MSQVPGALTPTGAPAASVPSAANQPASQAPESPIFEERHAPAAIDTFLDAANVEPEAPRPETERAVATDLSTLDSDLPIPLNDRVLAYVELFSGRLKGYIEDGLNRGGRYLPMVQDIFEAEGLPIDLSVRAAD